MTDHSLLIFFTSLRFKMVATCTSPALLVVVNESLISFGFTYLFYTLLYNKIVYVLADSYTLWFLSADIAEEFNPSEVKRISLSEITLEKSPVLSVPKQYESLFHHLTPVP